MLDNWSVMLGVRLTMEVIALAQSAIQKRHNLGHNSRLFAANSNY
jgi:hypothetical protein